jgi:hypothetical protein
MCIPAIDTRFFWERDFSMNEGFSFERGQPANRGLHIHALATIGSRRTDKVRSAQAAGSRWIMAGSDGKFVA